MKILSTKIEKNDLDRVNSLMRRSKAYWGYDKAFMDKFMQLFQITNEYIEKNTLKFFYLPNAMHECKSGIGFYSFSESAKGSYELDNFFIEPEHIGKGFGKKIWGLLLENFKSKGVNTFTLWSDPGAEVFYKKMGCIKIGVRQSPLMQDRYPVIFEYTLKETS